MKARAEASERLSGEIIASMTSGLLVVDEGGNVRTLNPAAPRCSACRTADWKGPFREVLAGAGSLVAVIDECLATGKADRPAAVPLEAAPGGASHLGVTVSPIRDEPGQTHGAICLFTDLTRGHGARGAAAAEGQPGAARRADRRHRARVPQRAGDDPRLRPAARPRAAAA